MRGSGSAVAARIWTPAARPARSGKGVSTAMITRTRAGRKLSWTVGDVGYDRLGNGDYCLCIGTTLFEFKATDFPSEPEIRGAIADLLQQDRHRVRAF